MAKDYYSVLGVSKGATDEEIKKAYRKLAHQHHPDKKGGDEAKFKEINEAYQVLSDKQKRANYDRFGQAQGPFQGSQGGGGGFGGFGFGGFDFESFQRGQSGSPFEEMFSDFFGGSSRSQGQQYAGEDVQVDVEIDFVQMATGTNKDIRLYKRVICSTCSGTGGEAGTQQETCQHCSGTGQIRRTQKTFLGSFAQVIACEICAGKGRWYAKKCRTCGGDGTAKSEEVIAVSIPAGISDGQTVSLGGKGEAGRNGAQAGDLYVTIHVKPHEKFTRRGNDLVSEEKITFSLASLGGKISVQTLAGFVTMKIPAGTQSGEIFRMKGDGFPEIGGRGRGNHLVKIVVSVPTKLTRDQRRMLEQIQNEGL